MPIQILKPDVAAKIAAGEVVERPANVAKELIENSLDAGATEIRVEIREGGQRLLRVTDNGAGIAVDEVSLAFERHATSKLSTADDLNSIATFGFRGEALYSIAAVSHVTLITRPQEEALGRQLCLEGGTIVRQSKAGSPVGTVLTVERLFFNMPARKKFLRKPTTEAGHISSVVQRYALAYPERRFSYVNEGRLIFQSTGSGDIFDVLVKIYGLNHAKQMVGVGASAVAAHAQGDELAGEIDFMGGRDNTSARSPIQNQQSPIIVHGYTSLPSLTRANRSSIDLFVNRRYVEDRSLTFAIIQAYHTLLPVGRNPVAAIFVEIDPSQVDVNVHPQKTQVRFHEERRVFSAVQKAVRRAVIDNAPIPGMGIHPVNDANTTRADADTAASSWRDQTGWAARRESILNAGQQRLDLFPPPAAPPYPQTGTTISRHEASPDAPASVPDHVPPAHAAPVIPPTSHLPPLRVVGQVGAMYIITEGPEGMYLIDQHAAHERILYEKFMAQRYGTMTAPTGENQGAMQIENHVARQQLLQPLTLHVSNEITGLVAQHLETLNHVGFDIAPFGGDTFLVRAVPSVLSGQDPLAALEEMVSSLATGRNLVSEELEARMVKMICKRAAIKAGQLLSDLEMQELVRQLEICHSPRTCPHGRPTMIQLSAGELEKAFGRI